MPTKFTQSTLTTAFTLCLYALSQTPAHAAPGSLSQIPLFVAPPSPPNIFFMLDDSGSMDWSMPTDGVQSDALMPYWVYDTMPDNDWEWNAWCPGVNLMAYNPNITYNPWAANYPAGYPNAGQPFPDMTDLKRVWVNPLERGNDLAWPSNPGPGVTNNVVRGWDNEVIDLSAAPVVTWTDNDNDGEYDPGECPGGNATTGYQDSRVMRADQLSPAEQVNYANWFAYYRTRSHATKAAVTQVIANTSARMGMATLHHNNGVGKAITDMTVASNKNDLLEDIVKVQPDGGTPLRTRLNWVGHYFNQSSSTPGGLNIGSAPSPILSAANGGECQQNFVMLMTDGQWNGNDPGVGHQDNTVDNTFVYPAHQDNTSETLADVAMRWYKTDLAPSLDDKVPTQSGSTTQNLDENNSQHLVTFTVAFGPNGTINADPVDRTQSFSWPAPASNTNTTVDDLRHAAYNGRGQFLSANNPETLISALQAVISDIESRQGSAAAAAFNTAILSSETKLFFASFDTTNWKGDLQAYTIDPVTGDLSTTATWSAATVLDNRSNTDVLTNRPVYTWGTDSSGNRNGSLFRWTLSDPQPDSAIITDLKQNQDGTTDSSPFTASQQRLNFIHGDTSADGTGLTRNRASRLGDIIHSAPMFVGEPVSNWPDSGLFGDGAYSSFQSALQSSPREPVVYVGANDGILHGFKASDGEEIFAYLPSATASSGSNDGLHYLTEADYGHRYYVDGSPISADVYIDPNASGIASWRTILVGNLRGGGQGVYALDVTDPNQFQNNASAAADVVLWEFTSQDDSALGYTFSDPQVTMLNNGKWAVILGNGYNAPGTNTAQLIILYIDQGLDGQWTINADYKKLDTGVGNTVNKNGLSTPTLVDLDNNGTTDRIYAGDLLGNLWVFDVSDSNNNTWGIAHQDSSNNPAPLFSAGASKPITMKPLVVKNNWINDESGNTPNLMVYFGTGQYIATGDATNTDQQTFYGIWDGGINVPAAKLIEQTFITTGIPSDARVLSTNSVNYDQSTPANGDLGWFIDLPASGERVVVEAFQLAGLVYFNTMIPSSTPCSAGGESWLMAVNEQTGGNPDINGLDYNKDDELNNDDKANGEFVAGVNFGFGIASKTAVITNSEGKTFGYTSGTNSTKPIKTVLPPSGSPTGERKSWIELVNQ